MMLSNIIDFFSLVSPFLNVLGVIVTAGATVFLWRATKLLSDKTNDMAEAMSRAHVVITILPDPRRVRHVQMVIDNTGNATAYDIKAEIKPIFTDNRSDKFSFPFQTLSLLRPGDELRGFVLEGHKLEDCTLNITISWALEPGSLKRVSQAYSLEASDFKYLTTPKDDPLAGVVEALNGVRNMFNQTPSRISKKRFQFDIFTHADRQRERKELRLRMMKRWRSK